MDRSEGRGFIVKGSLRAFGNFYVKWKNFIKGFWAGGRLSKSGFTFLILTNWGLPHHIVLAKFCKKFCLSLGID